jgi:hypothetical protein
MDPINSPHFKGCSPFKFKEEEFDEPIKRVSMNFVRIYNQAKEAEERGLKDICGIGYRKALEFLIKDYLIEINREKAEAIKKNHSLEQVINTYVTDHKIRFLTQRATWLGNDHAHYMKKWGDKEVEDLKNLIKASLHWISAEKVLEFYQEDMKDKRQ